MKSHNKHFSKKLFEINSNWTALKGLEGWNHYRIASRRRSNEGLWEFEMMAVCDREIRVWVPRKDLRTEGLWSPGWVKSEGSSSKEEVPTSGEEDLTESLA